MNQEKYAELFAGEAREHLTQIGRALVSLEAEPGDRDSLDAIFRSAHTIKGMAAAMGYEVVTRLAHGFESALDQLRQGRRSVEPSIIDLLLQTADELERAVEAVVEGDEAPDAEATIEQLKALMAAPTGREVQASPVAAPASGGGTRRPPGRGAVSPRRSGVARVHVDIRRLDALMDLIGELMIVRSQLRSLSESVRSEPLREAVERASRIIGQLQTEVLESRMVPLWQVFDRFPRLIRDAARQEGKEVEIEISGKELEIDRALLDAIGDPLVHLLRNAVGHGIESPERREALGKPRAGQIALEARREQSRIVIIVRDDGCGIDRAAAIEKARAKGLLASAVEPTDQELFRILARPGFSTMSEVTTLSGRGVGLNVVEEVVRGVGGSVELVTEKGTGSTFRIQLPFTVAMIHALMVEVSGQVYGLPITFTREAFEVGGDAVDRRDGREWVKWRERSVPMTRLSSLFGGRSSDVNGSSRAGDSTLKLVALEYSGEHLAVSVDGLVGEEELVVKTYDQPLGALPIFSGATVRPDGRAALLLDVGGLSDLTIRSPSEEN